MCTQLHGFAKYITAAWIMFTANIFFQSSKCYNLVPTQRLYCGSGHAQKMQDFDTRYQGLCLESHISSHVSLGF